MSLSINPLSTLVAKVTSETQAAIQAAEAAVPQIQNALEKAKQVPNFENNWSNASFS